MNTHLFRLFEPLLQPRSVKISANNQVVLMKSQAKDLCE